MSDTDKPFIALTAILDSTARAAAITRSHGDALERAMKAVGTLPIAGLDLIELVISPQVFTALRKTLERDESTVAVYDLFPLSAKLKSEYRKLAGQFLAAEVLWTLEEQSLLSGVPVNVKLEPPQGWDKQPKEIHARLVHEGALELTHEGVQTFKAVKTAWEQALQA